MSDEHHHQNHDRLRRTVSLPQPPEKVWAEISGFGQTADWHPLIASVELVEIEGDTYRHLTTTDGEVFLERLLETGDHHITYEIVDGPLPASDYRATLSCVAEENGCHVFWSAYYVPDPAAPELSNKIISRFYRIGLEAIQERFS